MTQTRIAVSHITKRYFLYRTALERLLHPLDVPSHPIYGR
jgi:hypothetical protein